MTASTVDTYEAFVARKLAMTIPSGIVEPGEMPDYLFPFQADLTRWALRRGRCALFTATGTGKTRMELAWADRVYREAGPVLMLTPLAVAAQAVAEAATIGVNATVCREQADVVSPISVTNYERLHKFDVQAFGAVVMDESSCVKDFTSRTFTTLTELFRNTPFRLCATATPSPNDYTELGTHAEFLGICTRAEMLSEYFVHDASDTQTWRLKGHARSAFWKWIASWGALVRMPSDLGYDDAAYRLPPIDVQEHVLPADQQEVYATGRLFAEQVGGLQERRAARKASVGKRVAACVDLVNRDAGEPWIVWCDLNAESEALTAGIVGAVEVCGSMSLEEKESAIGRFINREARVLVTKGSICGWGLNLQFCARMAFVGVTDSWETYHQSVRRSWRFGQTRPVHVHIFASEAEGSVLANLQRKERDAKRMGDELSTETAAVVRESVLGSNREINLYNPGKLIMPSWLRTHE